MLNIISNSVGADTGDATSPTKIIRLEKLTPNEREVYKIIQPNIARMDPGEESDARGLFGAEEWAELPPNLAKSIGLTISSLVNKGVVPLEPAGWNSQRHNIYRRK